MKKCKHKFHFVRITIYDDYAYFVCERCGLLKKIKLKTEENKDKE